MKGLKDIELKQGDIVYFENDGSVDIFGWAKMYNNYKELEKATHKIIKIERPKYETIFEATKKTQPEFMKRYKNDNKN